MAEPRVVDAEGCELKRGARVKRRILSGHWNQDVYRAAQWSPGVGWVAVTSAMPRLPLSAAEGRNTWRCPDLLLVTTNPGKDGQQHG